MRETRDRCRHQHEVTHVGRQHVRIIHADEEFDWCYQDKNYIPIPSSEASASQLGDEEGVINTFRDEIANALFSRRM